MIQVAIDMSDGVGPPRCLHPYKILLSIADTKYLTWSKATNMTN